MPVDLVNPEHLVAPTGYTYGSALPARSRSTSPVRSPWQAMAHLTGEGNLRAHTAQAIRNLPTALDAVAAGFDDVAQLTIYVPKWQHARREALVSRFRAAAWGVGGTISSGGRRLPGYDGGFR